MVSKSRRRREARERAAKGSPQVQPAKKRPRPRRGGKSTMKSTCLRQTGSDVVGVAVLTSKTVIGTGLLRFAINPRALTSTRLGDYAQLWSRWRPLALKLEVSPSAGLMIPGGYIVAWSANPNEEIPSGEAAIAHLTSLVTRKQTHIGQSCMLQIPCSSTARWYTFTGDSIDIAHGSLLAACSGTIGISGAVAITFTLHWTIEFNGPDIPRPLEEYFIEPVAEYAGIFTDSVSDWADGKKLTFKHAEGGSVVPWVGVRSGVVYEPTAGVRIYYVKSNGQEEECKFFSRIIDSDVYDSALCCHGSRADAEGYQKNGDLTKVLDYKAASKWAEPTLPRLKGSMVTASFAIDRCFKPVEAAPTGSQDINVLARKLEDLSVRVQSATAIDYDLLAEKLVSKMSRRPLDTPDSWVCPDLSGEC